jgi:Tfp pilus assembly protein PilF
MNLAPNFTAGLAPRGTGMLVPEVPVRSEDEDVHFVRARENLRATGVTRDPRVQEAVNALAQNQPDLAARLVSKMLARQPRNAAALNVKAELAKRAGRSEEAEKLFGKCVEIAPDCALYRYNYAVMLAKPRTAEQALRQLEELLTKDPRNLLYRAKKADLLQKAERYAEAAECYRTLTEDFPEVADVQINYGSVLRSLGRSDECVAALRKAAEIMPMRGGIWWSLASLKTFRFTDAEVKRMEEVAARSDLPHADRVNLHYALGTAYDLRKEYEKSFSHFARGNAIRRIGMDYDADEITGAVSRAMTVFTPEFFRERRGLGCDSDAPVFVVGMQRSGSTLVEQILGSHSQIEPVGELQTFLQIVGEDVLPKTVDLYPYGMERLEAADFKRIGERYLELAGKHRKTDRPYFVDKCGYNFLHIGLLRLALPNARIIDIRRHPLGCCFANFTISFQFAPPLSYSQTEIGRFYADYVRLMAHFDRVQPGTIHRVIYENLVEDLEGEVRRMLDHLGLPFEPACLEYYKTERVFSSFSNEQVRTPIFREGLDRWKNYEPWLAQMKAALSPVLDAWPDVPDFEALESR